MATYWWQAENRIIQDPSIKTPIGVIVHTLSEVNGKLAQGQYFFLDIILEGIALYEMNGPVFSNRNRRRRQTLTQQRKNILRIGSKALPAFSILPNTRWVRNGKSKLHFCCINQSKYSTPATC